MSAEAAEAGQFFPTFIREMSEVDIPNPNIYAWMAVDKCQVLFYEVPEGSTSPDDSHANEWGLVIKGQVDITIDGETKVYGPGDTYFVRDGEVHSVVNHPGLIAIAVFEGEDRFGVRGS